MSEKFTPRSVLRDSSDKTVIQLEALVHEMENKSIDRLSQFYSMTGDNETLITSNCLNSSIMECKKIAQRNAINLCTH